MNMTRKNRASRGKGGAAARVAEIAGKLPEEELRTLLQFSEFLLAQVPDAEAADAPLPEPKPLPRPAEESVIRAMRRLSETYFMLDRGPLLNETSALMAQHVMQGRKAAEVIDDLEAAFLAQYQRVRSSK
jgi:hypothetical protein